MSDPDFYLGSNELTAWSVPRAVRIVGPDVGEGRVRVQIDPPTSDGSTELIVGPRYVGDSIGESVVVNVFSLDSTLVGIGELYGTYAEAAATTGGVGR